MKRTIFTAMGIGVQIAILLVLTAYYLLPNYQGQKIVVEAYVVSWRDMYRGDYLELTYDFNIIEKRSLNDDQKMNDDQKKMDLAKMNQERWDVYPEDFVKKTRIYNKLNPFDGTKIYAVLEPDKSPQGKKSAFSAPVYKLKYLSMKKPESGVFLTGRYNATSNSIIYGIERYYIQNSTSRKIAWGNRVQILLNVTPSGRGVVEAAKKIYVEPT